MDNKFEKFYDSVEKVNDAEDKDENLVKVDLLDVLLDPRNTDPVILEDEDGKRYAFEQVAIIPYTANDEKNLYAVLKPIDKIEGVADDEAIVFRVNVYDDGSSDMSLEEDEDIAVAVYREYIKLLEENTKKD